jgi:hypothetical protein
VALIGVGQEKASAWRSWQGKKRDRQGRLLQEWGRPTWVHASGIVQYHGCKRGAQTSRPSLPATPVPSGGRKSQPKHLIPATQRRHDLAN